MHQGREREQQSSPFMQPENLELNNLLTAVAIKGPIITPCTVTMSSFKLLPLLGGFIFKPGCEREEQATGAAKTQPGVQSEPCLALS